VAAARKAGKHRNLALCFLLAEPGRGLLLAARQNLMAQANKLRFVWRTTSGKTKPLHALYE